MKPQIHKTRGRSLPSSATTAPLFVGLDLDAEKAFFAVARGTEVLETGIITLEKLESFVATKQRTYKQSIEAMACEYTGGIAAPWLTKTEALGIRAYVLHVKMRQAFQRLDGQSAAKTDENDARGIVRMLARGAMPELKEALGLGAILQPWEEVKGAWQLRALAQDTRRATRDQGRALNRAGAARRAGMPERASVWEEIAAEHAAKAEKFHATAKAKALELYPQELAVLLSIPRIGERTAVLLLGVLMPIERFEASRHDRRGNGRDLFMRKVTKYAGFCPRVEQSGKMHRSRMDYDGSPPLRSVLFMACLGVRADSPLLGEYGEQLKARETNGKKRIYLMAAKLFRIAAACLRDKTPYTGAGARDAEGKTLKPPKAPLPSHLISTAAAHQLAGMSRQALYQRFESGKLGREEWEGKYYYIRAEIEELAKIGPKPGRKKKGESA